MNLRVAVGVVFFIAVSVAAAAADDAAAIRARLEGWARDFNEGRVEPACGLFSKSLISDMQGQGEAGYETRCAVIAKAMKDPVRTFHYTPDIREIIVEGDIAIVRLQWKLAVSPGDVVSTESGLDVFRREDDGVWRIVRFIAFENE